MIDEDKLLTLARKWKQEAMEQVPEEYASRGLHRKYLKLDNEAAGLTCCADELIELLESDAEQRRVPDSAAIELLAKVRREWLLTGSVGEVFIQEINAILKTAAGG